MFNLFKNRIVQFEDGSLGVQVKRGWGRPAAFASINEPTESWTGLGTVERYCKTNSLAVAEEILVKLSRKFEPYKKVTTEQISKNYT